MKLHLPVFLRKAILSLMLVYGVSAVQAADLALGAEDTLSVDYSVSGSLQDLDNGSLQLSGGTTLLLAHCGEGDGKSYTLFTGVSGLLGADGSALGLDDANNDASLYFDTTKSGTGFWASANLQLVNGALQIVLHNEELKEALTITEQVTSSSEFGSGLQYYTSILAENVTDATMEGSYYTYGGVLRTWEAFTLSNNGSVTFNSNSAEYQGGAVYAGADLTLSNNGSVAFSSNTAGSYGGAIHADTDLTLSNNGSVTFSTNSAESYGGAIYADTDMTLSNNDRVIFSGNSVGLYDGGAIYTYGDFTLSNNGSVTFSENVAARYGGAICHSHYYTTKKMILSGNGSLVFSGNEAREYGGAIYSGTELTVNNNDSVTFSGNKAGEHGGAIYSYGSVNISNNSSVIFKENTSTYGGSMNADKLELNNNGSVLFENNKAEHNGGLGKGGALYSSYSSGGVKISGNDSVTFKNNASNAYGGAIYVSSATYFELTENGSLMFTGNSTGESGGAIYSDGGFILLGNDNITFRGNSSTYGGAVNGGGKMELYDNGSVLFSGNMSSHASGSYGAAVNFYGSNLSIRNNDSVVFQGNMERTGTSYCLRSIRSYGTNDTFSLSAGEGQIIEFRDSILVDHDTMVNLNEDYKGKKQTGDILFTGKYAKAHLNEMMEASGAKREATAEEIRNSRTTEIATMTNLYGGRLRVEDKAVYKGRGITAMADTNATVRVKGGTLSHKGYELLFQRGTSLEVAGTNGTITANKLVFEQGSTLTFKLSNENINDPIFKLDTVLSIKGTLTLNLDLEGDSLNAGMYKLMDLNGEGVPASWESRRLTVVSEYFDYDQLEWIGDILYLNNARNLIAFDPNEPEEPDTPIFPDEPEIPDTPVTPDEPETPDTPVTPDEPVVPEEPVMPEEPDGYKTVRVSGHTLSASDVTSSSDLILDGKGTVTLKGEVNSGSITVNVSKSLTLKSDKKKGGELCGDADLTKKGLGTLTLNNGNSSWTGDTYLLAGTIKVKGASSFGEGDVYVQGGTLNLGSKAIANDIIQTKNATIKGAKKFTGTYTLESGELLKGSSLNISETAILAGGTVSGKLSGYGTTNVTGNVTLGDKGKITTSALSLCEGASLTTGAKGLSSAKTAISIGSGAALKLNGKLVAGSLTLQNGGMLTLNSTKPVTLKVKGTLTLDEGSSIIMNCNFVQGKTYKLITFGSYSGVYEDEMLHDIFGVDDENCVLENTGKAITLTVTGQWNPQTQQKAVMAAATAPAAKLQANPVADALVQANWGQLEASRAFVNAIANRSMAVQLGNGERAVWASAIGSSSRHDTASGHNGADTNVSGGAFGLETQVGRASLFGMALGNSWTRVSAHGFGTIEQDTTHLGVYGQTNWRSGMTADWSAAYGRSESETMGCDWNQKHLQLDGRVSYNHELNSSTVLSPFAGVQYYASDSATVDGTDTGSLQNLRAEIGVAASRRVGKLGVFGEIAVHQDIARNNPSVSMEGIRYSGMNPGRTGINFTIGASYELNDKWSVNASYTGEVVENANAHSANVGASYKF